VTLLLNTILVPCSDFGHVGSADHVLSSGDRQLYPFNRLELHSIAVRRRLQFGYSARETWCPGIRTSFRSLLHFPFGGPLPCFRIGLSMRSYFMASSAVGRIFTTPVAPLSPPSRRHRLFPRWDEHRPCLSPPVGDQRFYELGCSRLPDSLHARSPPAVSCLLPPDAVAYLVTTT